MKFEIGNTYGGYEFLDTLGSAKTVRAFRVRNLAEQRTELLRILPNPSGGDLERQERFLREIKVRARRVHPNIVTFFHAGELEGQLVMTTELVEGPTLAERLELGHLPSHEAVRIIGQVLHALHCAHSHGVVHREVTVQYLSASGWNRIVERLRPGARGHRRATPTSPPFITLFGWTMTW